MMKSKKPLGQHAPRSDDASASRGKTTGKAVVLDFVQSRIEAFNTENGGGVSVRKDSHGYTLYQEELGTPVARLRPRESGDRFEVLCFSNFRRRWISVGTMGGIILSLDDALEFIAKDPMDCFWR